VKEHTYTMPVETAAQVNQLFLHIGNITAH